MGSIILHPPRPIPDVEDWETLLQAMRRGSYLDLALALCLLWVEIWVEVCVCALCVCVCYVTDQIFFFSLVRNDEVIHPSHRIFVGNKWREEEAEREGEREEERKREMADSRSWLVTMVLAMRPTFLFFAGCVRVCN